MSRDLSSIEPFEICTIRPPTENYSLTFRLTRNCGWNRCLFCPVYKGGATFSRRSIEEVKKDVDRAKTIDDLLTDMQADVSSSRYSPYEKASALVEEINEAKDKNRDIAEYGPYLRTEQGTGYEDNEEDERLKWFASWFKQKSTIEDCVYHIVTWRMSGGGTCFLGDANGLLLTSDYFEEVVNYIKERFPTLSRFTVYGRTRSASRKSVAELRRFREAGLQRIHYGVESGSDQVLTFMRKGVTAAQQIEGCRKTREAGISCSVYVMPGLGGTKWSTEHAIETARVITESQPDFVRLRTLEVFPRTALAEAVINGEFVEAPEEQVAQEIRLLVTGIQCNTTLASDSASNLLPVNGRLPIDREEMISIIDHYLSLSPREKLIFSFNSRLESFIAQYGDVPPDIVRALHPYIRSGRVDISSACDEDISRITRQIRSKLMP